jgi:post-segregation antitoxin (ccd killing protein)
MKKHEPLPAKRGRRPAKHSNPQYVQMSVYVPRELRNKVKARLAAQEMEVSGLVEAMLTDWLAKQKD